MIDIKLIRENPELVKENIKKKFQDSKIGFNASLANFISSSDIKLSFAKVP